MPEFKASCGHTVVSTPHKGSNGYTEKGLEARRRLPCPTCDNLIYAHRNEDLGLKPLPILSNPENIYDLQERVIGEVNRNKYYWWLKELYESHTKIRRSLSVKSFNERVTSDLLPYLKEWAS